MKAKGFRSPQISLADAIYHIVGDIRFYALVQTDKQYYIFQKRVFPDMDDLIYVVVREIDV